MRVERTAGEERREEIRGGRGEREVRGGIGGEGKRMRGGVRPED